MEAYLWFFVGSLALCLFDPFVWILTILAAWRSREWLDAVLWPLAIALGYGTAAHVALDAMDAYAATLGWEGRMVRVLIGALVMTLAAHAVFRWRRRRALSG